MNPTQLRELLESVRSGETPLEVAHERLSGLPYAELHFAKVDHHRELRTGFPEVVFGLGKTSEHVHAICSQLMDRHSRFLATRIGPEAAEYVQARLPNVEYHPTPRLLTHGYAPPTSDEGTIAVVAAGTADLPVAEEAAMTAEMRGLSVSRVYDVGVAGIHRLFDQMPILDKARVLIVVAGMEGALASVVGGMASKPVIAVPTSIGYGAHFGGLAPLLAMLNSCVSGMAVVNIDNGFGAGTMASMIAAS